MKIAIITDNMGFAEQYVGQNGHDVEVYFTNGVDYEVAKEGFPVPVNRYNGRPDADLVLVNNPNVLPLMPITKTVFISDDKKQLESALENGFDTPETVDITNFLTK